MFDIRATRTYLELRSPSQLQPARLEPPPVQVERADECPPAFYRQLYGQVGAAHHWTDRLAWSDDAVAAHLRNPVISLWVARVDTAPAGFFELRQHDDGSVELALFGLLPAFIGRGLGKHLLTEAVTRAWALGANRVWLHTSTLDHPAALPNYLRRGFTPFRTERYILPGE